MEISLFLKYQPYFSLDNIFLRLYLNSIPSPLPPGSRRYKGRRSRDWHSSEFVVTHTFHAIGASLTPWSLVIVRLRHSRARARSDSRGSVENKNDETQHTRSCVAFRRVAKTFFYPTYSYELQETTKCHSCCTRLCEGALRCMAHNS